MEYKPTDELLEILYSHPECHQNDLKKMTEIILTRRKLSGDLYTMADIVEYKKRRLKGMLSKKTSQDNREFREISPRDSREIDESNNHNTIFLLILLLLCGGLVAGFIILLIFLYKKFRSKKKDSKINYSQ